ncbi:hypothetical protein [Planctomycetes bacterium K23_9]|uniref:YHS domain protein n=1 Tax=Stieleria marina TaxID=1930275 RepID=A0A517NLV3_9BACT|nr:hypothetical protein K239x_00480 [Planctomycetes bacterium K23_9]
MFKKISAFLAVALIAGVVVATEADTKKTVQCVVANKAADMSKSVDYKDGKVYFCCGGCAGKFAKSEKKFAVKANHQLVATKQYEQKLCPFSSKPADPAKATEVAGVKVAFCCDGCKGKVESTQGDEAKMKLVFTDAKFAKAFKKVAKKK